MKAKLFFCMVMTGLVIGSYAQQQSLVLAFTASNIGQHVYINSILIENLTQGGDTTLYAPDTTLTLDYIIGQTELNLSGEKKLGISQNYPNPMTEQAKVSVYLPENTDISVNIYDLVGRSLRSQNYQLKQGYHTFGIKPGSESVYFFRVDAANQSKTIKMFNTPVYGRSSKILALEYLGMWGQGQNYHKLAEVEGNFTFSLGDELKFTASSNLGELSITAIPEENQTFPELPRESSRVAGIHH